MLFNTRCTREAELSECSDYIETEIICTIAHATIIYPFVRIVRMEYLTITDNIIYKTVTNTDNTVYTKVTDMVINAVSPCFYKGTCKQNLLEHI